MIRAERPFTPAWYQALAAKIQAATLSDAVEMLEELEELAREDEHLLWAEVVRKSAPRPVR